MERPPCQDDPKIPSRPESALYPVILAVPQDIRQLSGHTKVKSLSRLARTALTISCRKSGLSISRYKKNSHGAPVPENGHYWSLSHKNRYVAAVAAPFSIGIDIEELIPRQEKVSARIATPQEWRLGAGTDSNLLFYRFWTAKEAVLKCLGVGMRGLSHCRIVQIVNTEKLHLSYDGKPFTVFQIQFDGHIAALNASTDKICWTHLSKWD